MKAGLRVAGVAALVVLIAVGIMGGLIFRSAQQAADESARLAMFDELVRSIDTFGRLNQHYPTSLGELTIVDFQDGSSMKTVREFSCQSDGRSYSLGVESTWHGRIVHADQLEQ